MKAGFATIMVTLFIAGSVHAQQGGEPSGRGAVTGDPAASSMTPRAEQPTTGEATRPSRSGSGTSTSGGKDDNGDQGRDKMLTATAQCGRRASSTVQRTNERGYLSAMVRSASFSCERRTGNCSRAKVPSAALSGARR